MRVDDQRCSAQRCLKESESFVDNRDAFALLSDMFASFRFRSCIRELSTRVTSASTSGSPWECRAVPASLPASRFQMLLEVPDLPVLHHPPQIDSMVAACHRLDFSENLLAAYHRRQSSAWRFGCGRYEELERSSSQSSSNAQRQTGAALLTVWRFSSRASLIFCSRMRKMNCSNSFSRHSY
jgi:hypothetical protein